MTCRWSKPARPSSFHWSSCQRGQTMPPHATTTAATTPNTDQTISRTRRLGRRSRRASTMWINQPTNVPRP